MGLIYSTPCFVLLQATLFASVHLYRTLPENRYILYWCDQDANLSLCKERKLVVSAELHGVEIAVGFEWIQVLHVLK